MFSVRTEPFGPLNEIRLINTQTGESASIIPGFGAALNSLVLRKGTSLYDIVEGSDNYEDLISHGVKFCKGLVLFPFPNRIKDGKYNFEGKTYELDLSEPDRNNAIHGFAMQAPFTIVRTEADADKAEIELSYEELGSTKGYPFKTKLTVVYTLTPISGLICKCFIQNTDNQKIPVGLGWHPYFKTGSKVDTLELTIPATKVFDVDNRLIPTGKYLDNPFAGKRVLTDTQLDTGFMLEGEEGTVVTELRDPKQDVSVKIWQKSGTKKYNFIQVFIPKDRLSIAIEPMSIATDAFNNGVGLVTLEADEISELEYGIYIA